jgi:UDP-N-acetylmuramyl tripeptide synthase
MSVRNLIYKKSQKIICVFGCGGNRDKSKRVMMGKISKKYSDFVIITNDNPRFENPGSIARQILVDSKKKTKVILDRANAIKYALDHSIPDDVIIVAGKGHEQYQEVAGKKIKFSDINTINELSS